MGPTTCVIATTLNCNAKCVMCDIWKNRMKGELEPEEYAVLPDTLKDINISGGEPFLRKDLPELIAVVKRACPRARLVISTNGFLPDRIRRMMEEIVKIDPKIALRVSVDGFKEKHEEIRGIPGGWQKNMQVLEDAREMGVKDLGLGMTIMDQNLDHIRPVYEFTRQQGLQLSVTVATDSEIYFGEDKASLRPQDEEAFTREMRWLIANEYRHPHPKRWFRAWFESRLLKYTLEGKRPLPCDAGSGFFYLDSLGNVFACHLLPLKLGNLRKSSWEALWQSPDAEAARKKAAGCEACWMVCTSKSQIFKNLPRIAAQVMREKAGAHLRRKPRPVASPSR